MIECAGLRVLVVEDEGVISMLIEEYLVQLGCEVVGTASRLDEALPKAASIEIDVAVLDVNLAGKLSYPVAQLLHQRDVPFLFATGYGELAVPEELKAAPVLSKPFRQEQLARALLLAKRGRTSATAADPSQVGR